MSTNVAAGSNIDGHYQKLYAPDYGRKHHPKHAELIKVNKSK
jgi:hypothetical protein